MNVPVYRKERERERDRQTDRQRKTESEREREREREGQQTDRQTEKDRERERERERDDEYLNRSSVRYFVLNWHESIVKSGSPCLKCFQVLNATEKTPFLNGRSVANSILTVSASIEVC